MDTKTLLDRAKEETGSDGKTAAFLGVTRQRVSQWRSGDPMELYHTARLAELVGLRWADISLKVLADQAKDEKEREFWLKKWSELAKAAVLVLGIGSGSLHSGNAYASVKTSADLEQMVNNIQCVLMARLLPRRKKGVFREGLRDFLSALRNFLTSAQTREPAQWFGVRC